MLEHIPLVGATMQEKYHWVPMETPLYLIMDNAGGHGTNDAITNYVHTLKEVYNVEIIHQIPCGPELKILDLGMWMSLQLFVEKKHWGKHTDVVVLARTIQEAWDQFDMVHIEFLQCTMNLLFICWKVLGVCWTSLKLQCLIFFDICCSWTRCWMLDWW